MPTKFAVGGSGSGYIYGLVDDQSGVEKEVCLNEDLPAPMC